MNKELEQAKEFCRDFFGTAQFMFDGVGFTEALSGYLARVKATMLRDVQRGDARVDEQLELFEQQGILF